jgi:hypothetical protein
MTRAFTVVAESLKNVVGKTYNQKITPLIQPTQKAARLISPIQIAAIYLQWQGSIYPDDTQNITQRV